MQSVTDISRCDTPFYKVKELKYSEGTLVLDRKVEVRTWELWKLETEEKIYIFLSIWFHIWIGTEKDGVIKIGGDIKKGKKKKEKGKKGDRDGKWRGREREWEHFGW